MISRIFSVILNRTSWPLLYEKDVVMLSEKNFSDFLAKNRNVMVLFYAFWCPPCRQLAPEYAEAAEMLKGLAQLAMVDAYVETGLRAKYKITEYPTMYLFINGGERLHHFVGERNRNAITTWVKRKMAPAIYNITTMDTLVLESEDPDHSEEPAAEI
ncbi:hypothetical protein Pint_06054 [Pistacia integerrima]|uniref:Uncharacterized protein n=1 Tax=Pistacia integerrima TaxID=434235 RepID=A0ACC0Z1N6_9ROSI|nr:hypothetical protein Pint_06054 [Pistacia integerrima]